MAGKRPTLTSSMDRELFGRREEGGIGRSCGESWRRRSFGILRKREGRRGGVSTKEGRSGERKEVERRVAFGREDGGESGRTDLERTAANLLGKKSFRLPCWWLVEGREEGSERKLSF